MELLGTLAHHSVPQDALACRHLGNTEIRSVPRLADAERQILQVDRASFQHHRSLHVDDVIHATSGGDRHPVVLHVSGKLPIRNVLRTTEDVTTVDCDDRILPNHRGVRCCHALRALLHGYKHEPCCHWQQTKTKR